MLFTTEQRYASRRLDAMEVVQHDPRTVAVAFIVAASNLTVVVFAAAVCAAPALKGTSDATSSEIKPNVRIVMYYLLDSCRERFADGLEQALQLPFLHRAFFCGIDHQAHVRKLRHKH